MLYARLHPTYIKYSNVIACSIFFIIANQCGSSNGIYRQKNEFP